MFKHSKWYFNVTKWRPTKEEWLKLTSSIDQEEVSRINRFCFQEDAKSSLVGRALIRKFLSYALGRPSSEPVLTRNQHGRPEVCKEYSNQLGADWPSVLDFNVSHSGDYCVLAGLWSVTNQCSETLSVGVDVTKIVKKNTKPELDRFLELMSRREFSKKEWETIEQVEDDRQKCINFTRLWCLKESFIKSNGQGLSFGLSRLDFVFEEGSRYNIQTDHLRDKIIGTTKVMVDGNLANDWQFFETALDNDHLVAVGYNSKSYQLEAKNIDPPSSWSQKLDKSCFQELKVEQLLEALAPITMSKEENWNTFSLKQVKVC